MQTHETYIQTIARLAVDRLERAEPESAQKLREIKLVYGAGDSMVRGVTYYSRWINGRGPDDPEPFVEVCAFGEQDPVQLAGTTVHELGHVLAGHQAGHGAEWKAACRKLGLRGIRAAGTHYVPSMFAPELREAIYNLPLPSDGRPHGVCDPVTRFIATLGTSTPINIKPCGAGQGTRGGKSRGKGSGSRLLKLTCEGCGCVVRMTRKWIDTAGAPTCGCGGAFHQ